MRKPAILSVRISQRLSARLDRLAKRGGRSKSWYVNRMLEDNVDREIEIVDMILEGERDIERGNVVDHETVVAEFKDRSKMRRKRAA
ncbi:MAG: ribbon-helix-helix protein, CopG family [Alphaproteobacteria bacterium]|nr:ribbon-helix-helix protein, CopG family [Alphaproteobacteria bacterium]